MGLVWYGMCGDAVLYFSSIFSVERIVRIHDIKNTCTSIRSARLSLFCDPVVAGF